MPTNYPIICIIWRVCLFNLHFVTLCVGVDTCHSVHGGSQRTAFRCQPSSALWVPELELGLSGLAASAFTIEPSHQPGVYIFMYIHP